MMVIDFDGKSYDVDIDELDIQEAFYIKATFGFTLRAWQAALEESDPDALLGLYWLMQKQNGVRIDPRKVNFKVVKFIDAFDKAQKAEAKAKGDEQENPTTEAQTVS